MSQEFHEKDYPVWVKAIARFGFVAKGVVYFAVGLLAFKITIGMGGQTSGATNMLKQLVAQPFGYILLIILFVGLLAHAIWKFLNATIDVEEDGSDASGLLLRFVEFIVALLYLALSYAIIQILLGHGAKSSSQSTHIWITQILQLSYGKWIVLLVALITVIVGCYQFYYAYTDGFMYRFDTARMSKKIKKFIHQLGKIGIGSWGIVYLMMAFLFYQAAVQSNPNEAGGLGKALHALSAEPYGVWILGITSIGLMIYGLYLFVLSYYYKI